MKTLVSLLLAVSVTSIGACGHVEKSRVQPDGSVAAVAPEGYSVAKQIRYGFTLQNTTNRVIRDAEFWAYAPVTRTSSQYVEKIAGSHPFKSTRDEVGNEILHFTFSEIAPYAAKVITITANLRMTQDPQPMSDKTAAEFTVAAPYIESTDPEVVKVATELRTNMPTQTASAQYDWIVSNLKAETFIAEDRGAAYAVKNKYGDCTEFAYLFTAMSRANAIPARAIGGYVYKGNAILKGVDSHNWAEFKVDNTWQIADPQKQSFMENQSDYIAMRIIKSDNNSAMSNSHRFHYAGDGLSVRMN